MSRFEIKITCNHTIIYFKIKEIKTQKEGVLIMLEAIEELLKHGN